MKATTNCCSICGSNGFKTELPRMKPTWFGWKFGRALDGLQLMSDDDGKIIDALEKKPEKTWASYLFGIQCGDGSTRNPGSKLIHPVRLLLAFCTCVGSVAPCVHVV